MRSFLGVLALLLAPASAYAQYTANIQGVVEDPSAAGIASARIEVLNLATQVSAATTADGSGNYRFLSLAPGSYKVTAEAQGFKRAEQTVTLQTNQTLNLPITLEVGALAETVTVSGDTPLVNVAETRNQLTLETESLSDLPMPGRSFIGLVTQAPGVSGLGTMGGGQPGGAGTPGSGVDNYSTETAVDASANGQGTVANKFIIDGLNVTSGIRQGVLNLTPNPDTIQETSIQVNTFTSEYGGGSSIQMISTTKSGAERFHGVVSDYYNNDAMFAKTVFMGPDDEYNPFHSNNFSAAVGGPIVPKKQLFFFFAVEPLRSSASTGNQTVFFPDAEFASWARQAYPNTFGTKILNTYVPTSLANTAVSQRASDIFPTTCGTAATSNLPCSTAMISSGVFNSSSFRDGDQYFLRVDKSFANDRIYGSFFRTLLNYGGPNVIPQFSTTNHNTQYAFQLNHTHVFSPTTLNEVIFASNRIEGFIGETGDFTIPNIGVTGVSTGYGVGFAQGNFIQHTYQWRDVLTHVRGSHVLKFGYEGWFGDDVEPFQGPWSHPSFAFDNLLKLAQDAPHTQGSVMYDPIAGQQKLWEWNAASRTWGAFVQDTWKARRDLTVTLGFRYDDQGNPWTRSDTTVFGNFYLGQGGTVEEQIANGSARAEREGAQAITEDLQPACRLRLGRRRRREDGRARRRRRLRQLADVRERAGGVPRQPAGPDPADVLRGHVDAAGVRAGHERHAAIRLRVPAAGRIPVVSDRPVSRREGRHTRRAVPDRRHQPGAGVADRLHLHGRGRAAARSIGVGQHHLQRLAHRQRRGQRQPGRRRQLRRRHQRDGRRPAGQAAGLAADPDQFQLRLDRLRRQRSRRQLQRHHLRPPRPRQGVLLRRLVHATRSRRTTWARIRRP